MQGQHQELTGEFQSPGGFVFGVQGWSWGEQRPSAITFFLNGTTKVSDQHGRPIKGTVSKDGRPCYFEKCNHAQAIAALAEERVDWQTLVCAGWPQLPYDQLKSLKELPPTPVEELRKIPDDALRKDALRIKREVDEAKERESQSVEEA
jgi:hypothetical protein